VFVQMRERAQSIADEIERRTIVAKIEELENARGSTGFIQVYQEFIATVANHMTVFAPFMPMLAQMLTPK
jgi:hypothetical protein